MYLVVSYYSDGSGRPMLTFISEKVTSQRDYGQEFDTATVIRKLLQATGGIGDLYSVYRIGNETATLVSGENLTEDK